MSAANSPPPHNGKPTSHEAATLIEPTVSRLRRQVLDFIRSRGEAGATNEEIEDALALSGNTVRPRVWELCGNNGFLRLVRETDRTRLTRGGRKAVVRVALTPEELARSAQDEAKEPKQLNLFD